MELIDLLKAAQSGVCAYKEGDKDFNDVIRILDNEGNGLFKNPIRTITTERNGELGRCTAIELKGGLNTFGLMALEKLAGDA
ncbi:hypothetical protein JR064_08010 [Xanthomonas sp. CFBP 8703]|uniref:Uncharacterized protein n=1 Tax=Xanthomonas bonasiae TaxID=2810351 RepID=A0ABS3B198_9XANT|nr:hypothetical protein [Xanthomonas bonasiae]MBN6102107.1 hypothetical protein [Xanthomonas bonasiae]